MVIKKIDILNYITNFRQAPNDIKTYQELRAHLSHADELALTSLLSELQQLKVIREVEKNGEKAYQVTAK